MDFWFWLTPSVLPASRDELLSISSRFCRADPAPVLGSLLATCHRFDSCSPSPPHLFVYTAQASPPLRLELKRASEKGVCVVLGLFFFSNRKALSQRFTGDSSTVRSKLTEGRQAKKIKAVGSKWQLLQSRGISHEEPQGGELLIRGKPAFGNTVKDCPQER